MPGDIGVEEISKSKNPENTEKNSPAESIFQKAYEKAINLGWKGNYLDMEKGAIKQEKNAIIEMTKNLSKVLDEMKIEPNKKEETMEYLVLAELYRRGSDLKGPGAFIIGDPNFMSRLDQAKFNRALITTALVLPKFGQEHGNMASITPDDALKHKNDNIKILFRTSQGIRGIPHDHYESTVLPVIENLGGKVQNVNNESFVSFETSVDQMLKSTAYTYSAGSDLTQAA